MVDRLVFMTGGVFSAQTNDFLGSVPNTCIEKPFDEAELRKLVERMLDKARSESTSVQQQRAAAERLGKLTAREHQVLERIIAGRLNKQIADDLGISIKTVEAHRANIMEKLNANTVADLLKIALGATAKA